MSEVKQNLYVMVGIPGSGKSTYAKKNFTDAKYVSRDEIRFSLLDDNDEYFSKEDKVFIQFTNEINKGLAEGKDVVADATHLTPKSRAKLFSHLRFDTEKVRVIAVYMETPFRVCSERNRERIVENPKTYVPKNVLMTMEKNFIKPNFTECHGMFDEIRTIKY